MGILNSNEPNDNFTQHQYAPTDATSPPDTFEMPDKNFTDISSMFMAGNNMSSNVSIYTRTFAFELKSEGSWTYYCLGTTFYFFTKPGF